jgi:tetratricopeptide (TPR) repeat protein
MFKRYASALLTAAFLTVADPAISLVWSKPPDLAVKTKDVCKATCAPTPEVLPMPQEESTDKPMKVRLEIGDLVIDLTGAVDVLRKDWAPRLWDWISETVNDLSEQVDDLDIGDIVLNQYPGDPEDGAVQAQCRKPAEACEQAAEEKAHREQSAARLLEIGMECQARGDHEMARNCFEEVKCLCPGTALGQQAADQLKGMERLYDGVEESEARDLIGESQVDVQRINESKRMLKLAEKYAKAGDMDNAYLCYVESCAICPACTSGQRAAKELARLDAAKAAERRENGIEEQEPPIDRKRAMSDSEWQGREEARHLYQLGEHCRVGGDQRMAVQFYREAREVSPNTYYGQRSLQRINRIDPESEATDRPDNDRDAGTVVKMLTNTTRVVEMSKHQRIKDVDFEDQNIGRVDFLPGSDFRQITVIAGTRTGRSRLVLTDNDGHDETWTILVEPNR